MITYDKNYKKWIFFSQENYNKEFVTNKLTKNILKKKNRRLKTYILGNYILSNKLHIELI